MAILPFANVSADPNTEYLSDGITESLISNLSQLPNLKVMSRNSVFRYKGREVDPQAVGRDLKVQAVLTGRLVQRGDNLAISLELVDARDNRQLWGEQYNRKVSDILAVQAEIAREISDKLRLRLSGAEQKQLTKHRTENTEAYELYLKGRFYWNTFTEDGLKKAIEYYTQAVEKDPSYALAYAGLALSYSVLGVNYLPPKEEFPKAKAHAVKAVELDDTLADAQVSLGVIKFYYDWDWPGAEREFKRAMELSPNLADSYTLYGYYLETVGRMDEAIAETNRALRLDPFFVAINSDLGLAYYYARRYDLAIAQQRKTLAMDPNFVLGYLSIAWPYEQKGMYEEAIAELNKAKTRSGGWPGLEAEFGYAFAASGNRLGWHGRSLPSSVNDKRSG